MTEPPTAAAGREGGLPPPGGSGRSEYAYEYDYPLDALVDAAVEAAESVARDESAPPPQFGIEPIDTDDALPAATGPSGETWEVVRQAQGKVTIARARPLCLHPTAHHHNPCAPWLKVAKETLACRGGRRRQVLCAGRPQRAFRPVAQGVGCAPRRGRRQARSLPVLL